MKLKFALAATSLALASTANAAPIIVGQWYTFGFNGVGSALVNGTGFTLGTNPAAPAAPDAPWTFNLATAGTLIVTDGFNSGDQFTLSDSGSVIGSTSAPTAGANCGDDIQVCLATAAISKGTFNLAAGAHSLTGVATLSPFGGGAGFFIVRGVAAVPEASTWALMLVGFGAVGGALRARRRTANVRVSFV